MKNFKLGTRGIAYENFDGETVIVNLPIGHYYSLRGTAHEMLQPVIAGTNAQELASFLEDNYDIIATEASEVATSFMTQLKEAELLVEIESVKPYEKVTGATKKVFEIPLIETYNDMQELLVLDPIHDVNPEEGWPVKK